MIFATKQYCSKRDPLEVVQFMDLINIVALAIEMERNEFPQPTLQELLEAEERSL